jgi:hypothetical protein
MLPILLSDSNRNHKTYLQGVKTLVPRYILNKKSKVASKKTTKKTAKANKPSARSAKKEAPSSKLPLSTFDVWVTKQVRLGKKEGGSITMTKTEETVVLPKDTFETWIENQKPKESVQQKTVAPAPNTFDLWMSKQVEARSSEEEKAEPMSTPASEPTM